MYKMFSFNNLTTRNFIALKIFCRSITALKAKLKTKIPSEREKNKEFLSKYGKTKIGEVTINQLYKGMRGMLGLIYETSEVDPKEGIYYRGHSLKECMEKLPKAKGGEQPLPEGVFWLLLTGDMPTDTEVDEVSRELLERAALPTHVSTMIKNFPINVHPMSQFSAAITAMNSESRFLKAYSKGIDKTEYWSYIFEDAMDLVGKLPVIASSIYSDLYRDGKQIAAIDPKKDWSENFTTMLGKEDPNFKEFMRLYLSIHADHAGGNASAHGVHLTGSTLSDPYLSFAAGMNSLAGPLHGRASQNVVTFLNKARNELGDKPKDAELSEFVKKTLTAGQLIPGYGHSVLRKTDPRFILLRDFAMKHMPDDPLIKLVSQLFDVVPGILQETHKVQSPWPNIDAHSGVILQHYGIKETDFYTVIFGLSRSLGTLANLVWSRALGFPIEYPGSITTETLMKQVIK